MCPCTSVDSDCSLEGASARHGAVQRGQATLVALSLDLPSVAIPPGLA